MSWMRVGQPFHSWDLPPTADPAEAECGIWWEVHHPGPLLGDCLQRGLHPTPGTYLFSLPSGVRKAPYSLGFRCFACSHGGWGWGDIVRGEAIPPPIFLSFSPAQGLEIVNPQAAEKKVAEANQKYFSSMAEFLKVKGEKSGIMST